jgi:ribosomal protein S8
MKKCNQNRKAAIKAAQRIKKMGKEYFLVPASLIKVKGGER